MSKMATLYAYPFMKANALDECLVNDEEYYNDISNIWKDEFDDVSVSFEKEDEDWPLESEWPNKARYNVLPNIQSLAKNSFPPITQPEPVPEDFLQDWKKHCEKVSELEEQKKELAKKVVQAEDKLAEAEKTPQNYSAARWGAKSARDNLVKRLQEELQDAHQLLLNKIQEIDSFKATKKHLGEYIDMKKKTQEMYDVWVKEKHEGWKAIYGNLQPIQDSVMIPLFFHGANQIRSGEDLNTFTFPDDHTTEMCMKQLELGGYTKIRRENWTTITVFERR